MPTKQELLESIRLSKKTSYSVAEVNNFITSISTKETKVPYLKKGDVITHMVGTKVRPCVVAKVTLNTCWVVPLSSTEDELNLYESKSRFFGKGHFSKAIVSVKMDFAKSNFIGVYDNPKRLNRALRAIKRELSVL